MRQITYLSYSLSRSQIEPHIGNHIVIWHAVSIVVHRSKG